MVHHPITAFLELFLSRVRLFLIRKSRKIIHTCVKSLCYPTALFKGVVSLAVFNFRIIALVDAREHLHLYLRVSPLFAECFKPFVFHIITSMTLWHTDLLTFRGKMTYNIYEVMKNDQIF